MYLPKQCLENDTTISINFVGIGLVTFKIYPQSFADKS
jgi:hypothetical protein